MRRRILGAALALLAAAAGCGERAPDNGPGDAPSAPAVSAQDAHEQGRKIYNFRCYFCHGYSGDAKTLAATYLDPRPLSFVSTSPDALPRERMLEAVTRGLPGTAMKGFSSVLSKREVALVVDFVRREFMTARAENTRYHTPENGWPDHGRFAAAFPFATWEIPLDTPWEQLTPEQQAGKRLYLSACITCHDRAKVKDEGAPWDPRPVSYPRNQYVPGQSVDTMASASPYAKHEVPPRIEGLDPRERQGERLFQENCAFCHGASGTGRNWIGRFLEPHPRDLTDSRFMAGMTRTRLRDVIRDGLAGTSMPAWRDVLSEGQIEAIIAYIHRVFHPLAPETSASPSR